MSRECRRVIESHEHARDEKGNFIPSFEDESSKGGFFRMYETCTEGTPISPVFEKAEDCAKWCADNKVSAFGRNNPADVAWWLGVIEGTCGHVVVLSTYDASDLGRGECK